MKKFKNHAGKKLKAAFIRFEQFRLRNSSPTPEANDEQASSQQDVTHPHDNHPVGDRRVLAWKKPSQHERTGQHSLWVSLARLEEQRTEHPHDKAHAQAHKKTAKKSKRAMTYRRVRDVYSSDVTALLEAPQSADSHPVVKREQESHPIGDRRIVAESPPHAGEAVSNKRSAWHTLSGLWGYYFAAKFGLFWMTLIGFHPLENLLFAVFVLWNIKSRGLQRLRNIIAVILAFVLLYYDSWLPSITRVVTQASLLSDFSFSYLIELAGRFISYPVIGALLVISLLFWLVSKWINVNILVVAGILVLWIAQSPVINLLKQPFRAGQAVQVAEQVKPDLDKVLKAFFEKEAQRAVVFPTPSADAVPFDVIFIHICSLSWDDLRAVGLDQHPIWKRFDYLLTRFNSAASYSGPAAIHLLRANCGQQPHDKMYFATPEKCYLMGGLEKSGFKPELAMNHNGVFDDFLQQIQRHGRLLIPPMPVDGLPLAQYAFDKSPIYDDLSVLNLWMKNRKSEESTRVALFYSTVSLHDGNHFVNLQSAPNTLDTYKQRLTTFLDQMEEFMQNLELSGRRALVVMVPEHGAAIRGDKRQIAGLREIPTPAITLVPVGIKLVGGGLHRSGDRQVIEQATSYLAISHIVARMLEKSPYVGSEFMLSDYVVNLPLTPFVSQNEKSTMLEYQNRYYYNNGSGEWIDYSEFSTPDASP